MYLFVFIVIPFFQQELLSNSIWNTWSVWMFQLLRRFFIIKCLFCSIWIRPKWTKCDRIEYHVTINYIVNLISRLNESHTVCAKIHFNRPINDWFLSHGVIYIMRIFLHISFYNKILHNNRIIIEFLSVHYNLDFRP